MAVNDVYQLDFVQTYGTAGEELRNTFFYVASAIGQDAENLFELWTESGSILSKINDWQASHIKNKSVRVVNLFSLTDFYESTISGLGANAGTPEPPFVAVNITLKLNTRGIRPGSKRFAGLAEDHLANGIITASGTITDLNELATAMATPLAFESVDVFVPVVVKRILVPPDPPDHSGYYRLPVDQDEADWGEVVACLVNLKASHQTSRGNSR